MTALQFAISIAWVVGVMWLTWTAPLFVLGCGVAFYAYAYHWAHTWSDR